MNQEIQYKPSFALLSPYAFLQDHGLAEEADDNKTFTGYF